MKKTQKMRNLILKELSYNNLNSKNKILKKIIKTREMMVNLKLIDMKIKRNKNLKDKSKTWKLNSQRNGTLKRNNFYRVKMRRVETINK